MNRDVMEHVRPQDWPGNGHVSHVDAPRRRKAASDARDPWTIADGEVHVWCVGLAQDHGVADDLVLLDETERARADRFRFDSDRARYIGHHAFTRRILAGYLGVAPDEAVISAATTGKPSVESATGIEFNTSRSGGWSVVAVAGGVGVGVDVERIRPIADALAVADGTFTPRERRALHAAPEHRRDEAFLELWTRKEAVVKAFGLGLSAALDSFDVAAGHDTSGIWQGQLRSTPFMVRQLDVPAGLTAAVSVTAMQLTVRRMDPAMVKA